MSFTGNQITTGSRKRKVGSFDSAQRSTAKVARQQTDAGTGPNGASVEAVDTLRRREDSEDRMSATGMEKADNELTSIEYLARLHANGGISTTDHDALSKMLEREKKATYIGAVRTTAARRSSPNQSVQERMRKEVMEMETATGETSVLERIMLHCPPMMLLCRGKLVCKSFKHIIHSSAPIRRHIFIDPDPETPVKGFPFRICWREKGYNGRTIPYHFKDMDGFRDDMEHFRFVLADHRVGDVDTPWFAFRDYLVAQPPPCHVDIAIYRQGSRPMFGTDCQNDEGIRFGDLVRSMEEALEAKYFRRVGKGRKKPESFFGYVVVAWEVTS